MRQLPAAELVGNPVERGAVEFAAAVCDFARNAAPARNLRKALAERRRALNITVDRQTSKRPVLIVCSREQIRIIDYTEKKQEIISRQSPDSTRMTETVCKQLKRFSIAGYYFIFLFKPSSVDYARFLKDSFDEAMPRAQSGMEPILESEEIN